MPFAPEVCIPALHEIFDTYGSQLWSTYGFKDAFNPTQDWVATDYIGIDQGPIIIMIEHYRNQSVWNRFMQNTDIQQGLSLAGFSAATAVVDIDPTIVPRPLLLQNTPNPFNPSTTLSFNISIPGPVLISVHDLNGRRIRVLFDENRQSGSHQVTWDGRDGSGRTVASGTYFVRLSSGGESSLAKVVLSK